MGNPQPLFPVGEAQRGWPRSRPWLESPQEPTCPLAVCFAGRWKGNGCKGPWSNTPGQESGETAVPSAQVLGGLEPRGDLEPPFPTTLHQPGDIPGMGWDNEKLVRGCHEPLPASAAGPQDQPPHDSRKVRKLEGNGPVVSKVGRRQAHQFCFEPRCLQEKLKLLRTRKERPGNGNGYFFSGKKAALFGCELQLARESLPESGREESERHPQVPARLWRIHGTSIN